MLEELKRRANNAYRRYDRVFCSAKELAWKAGDYPRFRRRIAVGRTLAAESPHKMTRENGYLLFDSKSFGGTADLVAAGREIFQRNAARETEQGRKDYFHNIMDADDIDRYPAIMKFALNPDLLGTLSGYFGFLPELCSIGIMLSRPNERVIGSQHGHFDAKDSHHVKVCIAVEDVLPENGPFEFIPADQSNVIREKTRFKYGFGKRFKDASLFKLISRDSFKKVTAKAGDGFIVDTSNCLHFGSRVESGYRLMWFVHFSTFSEYQKMEYTPNGSVLLALTQNRGRFASNEATRLVLDVRMH